MQLRDYQMKLLSDIRSAWADGRQNVCAVLPTGGGKTVAFATILREHDGLACAIAHRAELVSQMSLTLAKLGVHHRIIAPNDKIRRIVTMQVQYYGRSYLDVNSKIAIASVDTIGRRGLEAWARQVTLWVVDECFVAGTVVAGRRIETLRVGDVVPAFNERTGAFENRKIVRVFRNPAPENMVRVLAQSHHVLYCTAGHPFWTRRGWVHAALLTPRDEVFVDGMHDAPDSNRAVSRWKTKDIRSEKRRIFTWSRVDRVEVYQRGHLDEPGLRNDDGFVYNIEVEGLHTYVANGVVVHNCHHVLAGNKWGKAVQAFPNARGLGVTATPLRADGQGLGRRNDGVFDALVTGPSQRALIDEGYLCEYRIFAPKSDVDLADVPLSASTGDYSATPLRRAIARSCITGDVVQSYLRIALGKLGVTFCTSVQQANETAAQFREAGVPAECVSAETQDDVRAETLRRFAERKILQLVNVDLFGEGFDLPAIEVCSMARPTASFGLYAQQFGRALRPMDGKPHALIIDHVGNVLRHGLPDAPRVWSLDRREKRAKVAEAEIKVRACTMCSGVYERIHRACPYCGHVEEPTSRAAPAYVDGDLLELDPAVLARLRGDAARIDDEPKIPYGASPEVRGAILKRHRERQAAQRDLRHLIAFYGGWNKSLGRDDSEGYRRFFAEFDIDVATAQTLGTRDATALRDRIASVLQDEGIKP